MLARPNHRPLKLLLKLKEHVSYHRSTTAPSQPSLQTAAKPAGRLASDQILRFAICGGGPAGFYSASRLLQLNQSEHLSKRSIAVDLFEALPTPFGLSRYGVAPDHPEVKNCEIKFSQVAEHPKFRFFGNTRLVDEGHAEKLEETEHEGRERTAYVTLKTLRQEYDIVLLAYGASLDRCLGGIPGERELENILPARAAVNWYNGYPSHNRGSERPHPFVGLSQVERVTIIGQGNVALDIARILLTHVDDLATTDISAEALQALAQSRVKHVDIVGRRGPLQVAFTTKELRELVKLKDVDLKVDQTILTDAMDFMNKPKAVEHMANGRMTKRLLDLMYRASQQHTHQKTNQEKSCSLIFLQTPVAFNSGPSANGGVGRIGEDGSGKKKVRAVEWQLNKLDYSQTGSESHQPDYSSIRAIPIEPETRITTPADLVFKSLGYRPVLIEPLELDPIKSCVRNQDGRAVDKDGKVIPGLYVTGWLSRGPNGVIANTMTEAFQTVDTIIDDLRGPAAASSPLLTLTKRHGQDFQNDFVPTLGSQQFRIDWDQWKKLDQIERARGSLRSKPREKFLSVFEMLKALRIV